MEDHADDLNIRVFRQRLFYRINIYRFAPVERAVYIRDLVLIQDLLQPVSEFSVADQQSLLPVIENRGQHSLIRGGSGAGYDHCLIGVIRIENLQDLLLQTRVHRLELFAAMADIIMHQGRSHIISGHNRARTEQHLLTHFLPSIKL